MRVDGEVGIQRMPLIWSDPGGVFDHYSIQWGRISGSTETVIQRGVTSFTITDELMRKKTFVIIKTISNGVRGDERRLSITTSKWSNHISHMSHF